MPSFLRLTLASPLAALVAFAAPAVAQQQQITEQEIEAYFQELEQQATELVQADEFDRMVEWIERNIAEGAQFQVSMNLIHEEEGKGFAALTLDKQDMLGMGGLMAAAFQQQPIEEYSLEVGVSEIVTQGPQVATVRTSWTESFTVAAPQGEEAEEAPDGRSLGVEGTADCVQIIERQGDRLVMGLMTCTGEVRL